MKRRENWIRGAIFIGALIIGLIFGAFIVRPPHTANSHLAPASTATTGVSVMLDYNNGTISTYSNLQIAENETLFQLMQHIAAQHNIPFAYKNYSGLGALITQIGADTNGTGGRYWQYLVNNTLSSVGASSYIPRTNDVIEWKFITTQQ